MPKSVYELIKTSFEATPVPDHEDFVKLDKIITKVKARGILQQPYINI